MFLTASALAQLYNVQTQTNLETTAKLLNFSSINEMLSSKEFDDIIEISYSEKAIGTNNLKQKILSFKAKNSESVKYLNNFKSLKQLNDCTTFKNTNKCDNDVKFKQDEPNLALKAESTNNYVEYNEKVMEGKERLLRSFLKLNKNCVTLFELQKQYYLDYHSTLNKEELLKYFGKTHIKQVFEMYMHKELDYSCDIYVPDLLKITLKKPLQEILSELNKKNNNSFIPSKIKTQLNEGHSSENLKLVPLISKMDKFYTDDEELAQKLIESSNVIVGDLISLESDISNKINRNTVEPNNVDNSNYDDDEVDSIFVDKSRYEDINSQQKINFEKIQNFDSNDLDSCDREDFLMFCNYVSSLAIKKNTQINENDKIKSINNVKNKSEIFEKTELNRNKNNTEWSSSINPTISTINEEFIRTGKDQYTKRSNGIFTDDEEYSTSEDELEENNRQIQFELQQEKKIMMEKHSQSLKLHNNIENSDEEYVNWNKNSKKTYDNSEDLYLNKLKEERDSRELTFNIAQQKYYNQNKEFDLYVEKQLSQSKINPLLNKRSYPRKSAFGIGNNEPSFSCYSYTKNDYNLCQQSMSKAFSNEIEKDFLNLSNERRRCYSYNVSDKKHFDNNQKNLEFSNDSYILALNICNIVMNHKSILLNNLEAVLKVIYNREIVPGQNLEVVEKTWPDFIKRFCRNVGIIGNGEGTMLVWKAHEDKEFLKLYANTGIRWCNNSNF